MFLYSITQNLNQSLQGDKNGLISYGFAVTGKAPDFAVYPQRVSPRKPDGSHWLLRRGTARTCDSADRHSEIRRGFVRRVVSN